MKQLSKQEAISSFVAQQEMQLDQMDEMIKNQGRLQRMMQSGASEEQQKEAMLMIVMEQCRSSDKCFFKTGVDEDALNEAMEKHKLQDDPEFKQTVQKYVQKI